MGIGTSLIIFAVGAVMRFAISVTATGFNIHTVGIRGGRSRGGATGASPPGPASGWTARRP